MRYNTGTLIKGDKMGNTIKYKGTIKLFGLFIVKRDLNLIIELLVTNKVQNPNPYLFNSSEIKILEPFLRKICTISWVPA